MFENQRDIWNDGLEAFNQEELAAMRRGVCYGKGGGGGAAMDIPMEGASFSDRRLKTNIHRIN